MKTVRRPASVRRIVRAWRAAGERVGFVPTMGALHEGHRALLRRAARECDRVVASIFVNPLQFGPGEDYRRYPRPLRRDRAILRQDGVDLLYLPEVGTLYGEDFATRVSVGRLSLVHEGAHRPGHFDGVATVVAKLLLAAEPDRLYLGQKDAQQAVLLRWMIDDLDFGVRVVVCPTVRERDGLAVSSRNAYLSDEERAWAPALHRALGAAAEGLRSGTIRRPAAAAAFVRRCLSGGPGRLDYAIAVDAGTFGKPKAGEPILLALAYRLPSARLIDNVVVPARRRR